jgi:lambda family phage minor tail protein L
MPTKSEIYSQITGSYYSINSEISNLQPSSIVNLYEIDLQSVYPVTSSINQDGQPLKNGILRIYNDYNLFNLVNDKNGRILWKNQYYYPFPILAEGFDLTTLGTRPTPKIYISNNNPDQSYNSFYKYLRMQIQTLGDLAGCKFTRIKTFLKYLNGSNFAETYNPYTNDTSIYEVELPKDIYYIDRKSSENASNIEYTLVSALDIENLSLPNRTILAKRCPYSYRGEGCLYEYNKRITKIHSGVYGQVVNSPVQITLPLEAPPVCTENDEMFLGEIFTGNSNAQQRFSGIGYFQTGITNNYSEWSFTNYTYGGAGTPAAAAAILNDGSTSVVGVTSQANLYPTVTLSLLAPAEITRVNIASNATFQHNYTFEYSQDNSNWYTVPDVSGLDSFWNLQAAAASTYTMNFPSKGFNKYWRLRGTNLTASTTAITELNFLGQYRIGDSGLWATGYNYQAGDYTYFENNGIKYYYVCIKNNTASLQTALLNNDYWRADACTKSITACRNRWFKNPALRPVIWPIPRNGWTWDRAVYHYDVFWGNYGVDVRRGYPIISFSGLQNPTLDYTRKYGGLGVIFNASGYHRDAYGPAYRIGKVTIDPDPLRNVPYFAEAAANRLDCWPRRPDALDPLASFACGIPKDVSGNYLNGFLPFGGFPGTNPKA